MRLFLSIGLMLLSCIVGAQTTIFSENMGTGAASNPSVATYTGFQNYGTLTYTGTGDVRTTSASTGYTGASGSNNVFLTNTVGKYFQMEGINTSSCSSFTLSFGVFKSTAASNGSELAVEVSTDGTTYSALTMPALSTSSSGWFLVTITSGIPSAANLRIRFTNNSSTVQFRIDDIVLLGNCGANSITTGAVSSTNFTWTCGGACNGTVAFTSSGSYSSGNVYSVLLSSSSGSFSSPITIGTLTSTANSGTITITIPWNSNTGSGYQVEVVSSNPAITGSASSTFSITPSSCCPYMTGAVLNSCNNPGCNEGDAEIMLFNSGSYSITVSSLPAHTINYYGNATNFSNNTIDAYTGTASANAGTTTSLNSLSGCGNAFIDASAAGTIPAYSTFIMVPSNFCYSNYDFSALCANFSPIYVVYFSTTGWNTSGNLANYQSGANPKYLTADFSWVSGCSKEYYTFDASSEYSGGTGSGDGASVSYSPPVSTASATPDAPDSYTGAGSCALPIVLPLNLVEFKAEKYSSSLARVSFATTSETNVLRYSISKSYDAFNYVPLGEFNAHNANGQFQYMSYDDIADRDLAFVYYRLAEQDQNGVEKVIANCLLEVHSPSETWIFSDEEGIAIKNPGGISHAQLYAAGGAMLKSLDGVESQALYHFETGSLPRGLYIISATDFLGKTVVKKIVR